MIYFAGYIPWVQANSDEVIYGKIHTERGETKMVQ
jgi:hypothetical protein